MSLLGSAVERERLNQQLAELAALDQSVLDSAAPLGPAERAVVDEDHILQQAISLVQHSLNCQACGLYLCAPVDAGMALRASCGVHPPECATADEEIVQRAARQVLETGRAVRQSNVPDTDSIQAEHRATSVRSLLAAPVLIGGQLVGVLCADDAAPDAFDAQEADWMGMVAAQLSVAIANARLLEQLRQLIAVLQLALDAARRSSQAKSESLNYLSHEVRTPLTFITGYVQLMLEGAMGEITPPMRQALTVINQRSQAAVSLMSDVMSLEQVEMGKLEFEPVSVAGVIENSIAAARLAAEAQRLAIQLDLAKDLPPVNADARRLAQVFDNLLANAIKFSSAAGHISVRAFCRGEHVHVEVADQGIGIPTEQLDRIFDRYYQVENAQARGRGGSGLGLAIVKSIVEAHGGQVTVSSQVGVGSTFCVRLPVMRAFSPFGN